MQLFLMALLLLQRHLSLAALVSHQSLLLVRGLLDLAKGVSCHMDCATKVHNSELCVCLLAVPFRSVRTSSAFYSLRVRSPGRRHPLLRPSLPIKSKASLSFLCQEFVFLTDKSSENFNLSHFDSELEF